MALSSIRVFRVALYLYFSGLLWIDLCYLFGIALMNDRVKGSLIGGFCLLKFGFELHFQEVQRIKNEHPDDACALRPVKLLIIFFCVEAIVIWWILGLFEWWWGFCFCWFKWFRDCDLWTFNLWFVCVYVVVQLDFG